MFRAQAEYITYIPQGQGRIYVSYRLHRQELPTTGSVTSAFSTSRLLCDSGLASSCAGFFPAFVIVVLVDFGGIYIFVHGF